MSSLPEQIPPATLRLLLAPGIGPITLRRLREYFGDDERAAAAGVKDLVKIDGIGPTTAAALHRALGEVDLDAERSLMVEHQVKLVQLDDEDYPALLAAIDDPPCALWVRGELTKEDRLAVGIVGSRNCSSYGREQAGRFASLLAQAGLTIVSGGALGIDGEAHRGALRVGGRTIVVMGCGLAQAYPTDHEELFEKIVRSGGAVISDYPMRIEPLARHFPRRNRIISGLSLGVLVIEASRRSGALITARLAAEEHGREVMALPGRVDSPASAGCLDLLQQGGAALVVDHADVLRQLDDASHLMRGALEVAGHADAASEATLFDGHLTEGQRAIVDVLSLDGGRLLPDQLASRTGLPLHQLLADLTLLEIRGRIQRDHRGARLKS